jgi:hypothetical protein
MLIPYMTRMTSTFITSLESCYTRNCHSLARGAFLGCHCLPSKGFIRHIRNGLLGLLRPTRLRQRNPEYDLPVGIPSTGSEPQSSLRYWKPSWNGRNKVANSWRRLRMRFFCGLSWLSPVSWPSRLEWPWATNHSTDGDSPEHQSLHSREITWPQLADLIEGH